MDKSGAEKRNNGENSAVNLDSFDMKILSVLSSEGRISWRDLADRIGLSLTPTLRRVRRLENEGYIEGYSAILDEQRLKGGMSVFVSLTLDRQSEEVLAIFEREISAFPEVLSCFMMTGTMDYLLRIVVRDLAHYQLVLSRLTAIRSIAHVSTSFALKSVVRRPGSYI